MTRYAMKAFDCDEVITAATAAKAISEGVRALPELCYSKLLTREQAAAIFEAGHAAGVVVWITTIFETTAERALAGAAAGTADAAEFIVQAKRFGQPLPLRAYMTTDFDEQTSQDPQCIAYAGAFRAGLGGGAKMGIYGNGAFDAELKKLGIADFEWIAGGKGMRGTRTELATGAETEEQDVGDAQHLGLGNIDSDTVYVNVTDPLDFAKPELGEQFGGWSGLAA